MTRAPTTLRIRSYNVGFGDCFLLTFSYTRGRTRNVLIDFGTTGLAEHSPPGGMIKIAKQIQHDCDGKLDVVVATHRHADHISGFAGAPGKIIRALDPELVVQPWTEHPDLDPQARQPATAAGGTAAAAAETVMRLSELQAISEAARQEADTLPGPAAGFSQALRFLGETNIRNPDAVRNLMALGRKRVYVGFGEQLDVKRLLPGVTVDVLGPPTLTDAPTIADSAQVDPTEFWHLAAGHARSHSAPTGEPLFPDAVCAPDSPLSQEARWVIPKIDQLRAETMLAIVRSIDGALNNTSLILAFEVAGTLLIFPGDAQLESWRYALRDSPNASTIRTRLANAAFYKVGHHGSLNATPKTLLWEAFGHRGPPGTPTRIRTLVSTRAGRHGSARRGTEVPRKPLIEALTAHTEFHSTQSLQTRNPFWVDVEFDFPAQA